jgi:O-acetyl-ADP-ribose deacetylase (regulator of RNase III)
MKIQLVKGDITKETTDAIVNAANNSLLGGGGVDGAIHRAGGPKILEECKLIRSRQGGCPTGEAVYTSAGNLPAQYVIHTVGPVWQRGGHEEETLLKSCYEKSLSLAENLGIRSIAFPNISTGVYGFPKEKAAEIAVNAVRNFPAKSIGLVRFVCFDDENYQLYEKLL